MMSVSQALVTFVWFGKILKVILHEPEDSLSAQICLIQSLDHKIVLGSLLKIVF